MGLVTGLVMALATEPMVWEELTELLMEHTVCVMERNIPLPTVPTVPTVPTTISTHTTTNTKVATATAMAITTTINGTLISLTLYSLLITPRVP